MARHKKHEEHENQERWLLTYADMITLLVAFFMMLYAMSVVNVTKFQQLAISVRSGFGGIRPSSPSILIGQGDDSQEVSITPSPAPDTKQRKDQIIPNLRDDTAPMPSLTVGTKKGGGSTDDASLSKALAAIREGIDKNHLGNVIQVKNEERGIVITVLTDKFLFDKGKADLRPQNLWVLDFLAKPIGAVKDLVRVEGYTDNLPIHTAQFPSNWELSSARATNVLHYFQEHGNIAEQRLSTVGYADTRPIMPDDTEEHRARNRRVDIVILRARADNGD